VKIDIEKNKKWALKDEEVEEGYVNIFNKSFTNL